MADITVTNIRPDRAAVASQWQLIWWAFKRHKLAMAALVVTVAMYIVALFPGFFAINDPVAQNARATFHPPQQVHFFDTSDGFDFWPHYYPLKLSRDPQTLAAIFTEDKTKKIPITFFGRGYTYSVLGLFETDIHLIATTNKAQPLFLFGAIGLAATSIAAPCRALRFRCRSALWALPSHCFSVSFLVEFQAITAVGSTFSCSVSSTSSYRCRRSRSGWRLPPRCRRAGPPRCNT